MHTTTDASSEITAKHTSRGKSPTFHYLIAEAMAAAMTPTPTPMMMPSTSIASTPQPTGNDGCQYSLRLRYHPPSSTLLALIGANAFAFNKYPHKPYIF